MTPRRRTNQAVYTAIRVLSSICIQFSTMDIARVSTYSQPTVIRAIQDLERSGIIAVERRTGARSRYTILAKMPDNGI